MKKNHDDLILENNEDNFFYNDKNIDDGLLDNILSNEIDLYIVNSAI